MRWWDVRWLFFFSNWGWSDGIFCLIHFSTLRLSTPHHLIRAIFAPGTRRSPWELFLACTKYCIMIRRNIQTICIGERWGFFAPILLYLSHIRRAGWGFLRRILPEFQAALSSICLDSFYSLRPPEFNRVILQRKLFELQKIPMSPNNICQNQWNRKCFKIRYINIRKLFDMFSKQSLQRFLWADQQTMWCNFYFILFLFYHLHNWQEI